jgi:hypothetical protein
MKKALISPVEHRTDGEGNPGFRVAQVESESFEVADPLFWVDCPDDCVQDTWIYVDGQLIDMTPPPPEEVPAILPPLPVNNFTEL